MDKPTLEQTIEAWSVCRKHTGLMGIRNLNDISWIVNNDKDSMVSFLKEICEIVGWRDYQDDN